MPNKGHGQASKLARKLDIHTSLVSQILQGPKHFTMEQACDLGNYLGLREIEVDYLIALVLRDRAGNQSSKSKFNRDLLAVKSKAGELKNRIKNDLILSDANSAIFYSGWEYAGIKLAVSLPDLNEADHISDAFNIPLSKVREILEFLVNTGLCIERNGEIKQGPAQIHLESKSPFISRHHLNWRLKALEKVGAVESEELRFTMPANLSESDVLKVRAMLVECIDKIVRLVDNSKAESMYCLNMDWIRILLGNQKK